MGAVGIVLLVAGGFLVYEVLKGGGITAASASTPTGAQLEQPLGDAAISHTAAPGAIPTSWVNALAANESPSALQGDFNYGAFGLSCGTVPGYPCTPPQYGGAGMTPPLQLFPNWAAAVSGLEYWVNQNAPEAWGFAAAGNCQGFFQALVNHNYCVGVGCDTWANTICGRVA